jgi:hypothetical protein
LSYGNLVGEGGGGVEGEINKAIKLLFGLGVGCPRNKQEQISVRTETNRNKICFAFVSVCFMKPKRKNFGKFRCFETTETNRSVS